MSLITIICPECRGQGKAISKCTFCYGTGLKEGIMPIPCEMCSGKGKRLYDPCDFCYGLGKAKKCLQCGMHYEPRQTTCNICR